MIRNIVYYVTGHGLGHATRSLEIINIILNNSNQYKLYIVTSIDKSFFINSLCNNYNLSIDKINNEISFESRILDSGAIQSDALTVNKYETLKTYYDNIHLNRSKLLEFETKWLNDHKIELALIDATPLAVRASSINNIKTILLTNFTWDFIYSEMIKNDVELEKIYSEMITQVSQDYSYCNLLIQYPGKCPVINILSSNCIEGPLISRSSKKTKDDVRKEYSVSVDKKILLIGFGGHNFNYQNIKDSYLPEQWLCFVLGANEITNTNKFISLSFDCYIPDLLIMADCVIGKIGYGFVSECLCAGCPLIYISRSNWSEEHYLIELLQSYNAGFEMNYNDFISGNWNEYLDKALLLHQTSWKLKDIHNSKNAPEIILKQIESSFM